MMIYLENESIDDFEQVSITHEILELKGQLLISILNSETGQRGFLLTSNQDYLEPYNKGVADAKLSLSQLQVLTISDSEQQAMFLNIENLMNQKFSEMQSTINLHFAKRFEESLAVVNSNKGKQLMDKIRMMLDVFNSHLIRKRDQQQTELINLQEKMRMIFILESVFFGIVLFFLTTIVSKTILQPINQLTKSAKAFEVDKEFIPVQIKSRDELSVLGRAFNTMADIATTAAKNLQVDVNKVKRT